MKNKIELYYLVDNQWKLGTFKRIPNNIFGIRIKIKMLNKEHNAYTDQDLVTNLYLGKLSKIYMPKETEDKYVHVGRKVFYLGKFDKVYVDRESMIRDFKVLYPHLEGSLFIDTVSPTIRVR